MNVELTKEQISTLYGLVDDAIQELEPIVDGNGVDKYERYSEIRSILYKETEA